MARKLYEGPPPGERELYVSLFRAYVELRPQVEIRGYVARSLWDRREQGRQLPQQLPRQSPRGVIGFQITERILNAGEKMLEKADGLRCLRYVMVELDGGGREPMEPFECAKTSKEYLVTLGYTFRAETGQRTGLEDRRSEIRSKGTAPTAGAAGGRA